MSYQERRPQSGAVVSTTARKDIRAVIQAQEAEIARALPRHMKADRMIRVMLTAINSTPKLLACTQESLLACLMKCSQYGLEPDGRHAHLIPYKDQCQLIFDYKGLVVLVRRSGDIADIHCDVVYEKDEFEFSFGSESVLRHRPNLKEQDRGEITCAYSFVKLKDGSTSFEVMPWWEIEAVKEGSQGYQAFKKGYTQSNPWDTNWNEMAKKTAFRRHSKWLPLSFELAEAISSDDDRQSDEARFNKAKPVSESTVTLLHAPVEQQEPALTATPEPEKVEATPAAAPAPKQKKAAAKQELPDEVPFEFAAPEPAPAPEPSATDKLLAVLHENGFSFVEFVEWAVASGQINDPINSPSELDPNLAETLYAARKTVIKSLQSGRGK